MQHDVRKLPLGCLRRTGCHPPFLAGKNFAAFAADRLLRSGVERQFEIVGEALTQLAKLDPETARKIPDLKRAVAFRNVLIHAYAEVDHELVWRIAMESLPALREKLDDLLHRT
jgi:uncharacterized protein with HEPN domain